MEADFVFHLGGREPAQGPGRVYAGQRRFHPGIDGPAGAGQKAACGAGQFHSGCAGQPLRGQQARRRGRGGGLCAPLRNARVSLPAAQRVRQVEPPQLQQRGGHLLSQHRARPAITVNDPAAQVPLVYIDDVAAAFVRALEGAAMPDAEGRYAVKPEYRITVGDLAAMLGRFRDMRDRLECPDQSDPLTAKLYATYLSFLPPEDFARPTITHAGRAGIVYGAFASGRPWTGQRERLPSAHHQGGALASHQA